MRKRQCSVAFNQEQNKLLRKESKRFGSSVASVVRRAVTEYFQKQKVKKVE